MLIVKKCYDIFKRISDFSIDIFLKFKVLVPLIEKKIHSFIYISMFPPIHLYLRQSTVFPTHPYTGQSMVPPTHPYTSDDGTSHTPMHKTTHEYPVYCQKFKSVIMWRVSGLYLLYFIGHVFFIYLSKYLNLIKTHQ